MSQRGSEAHRRLTMIMSCAMIGLGASLVVVSAVRSRGALSIVLGCVMVGAGWSRLMMIRRGR